ncbi:beta strand repeat-containing protein [Parapedobacter sp. 10938]|uniref:beta strand repeat-containing protein n=1 Tax=Parapedobacter flavus TaxID=3110225 RepID=UPI002DB69D24|nr:Ig-like domain-containing protein [Parapedobacter sp. 10938]MEC3880681.1 Ig-like domain-containing protein [Parapedobacter sp. 10938]
MKNFYSSALCIGLLVLFASQGVRGQTTIDFNRVAGRYGYGPTFGDALPAAEPGEVHESIIAEGFLFSVSGGLTTAQVEGRGNEDGVGPGYNGSSCLYDNGGTTGDITKWTIKKGTNGDSFRFVSIYLEDGGNNGSIQATITGYKGGVAKSGATVSLIPSNNTELLDFSANPDFFDVDLIEITADDINFYLDEFTYGPPTSVGDTDPAEVLGISLVGNPASTATTVSYTVTFSKAASNVDITDFELTKVGSATGTIASITGSGTTYTAVINGISGEGNIRLDLKAGTDIENGDGLGGTAAFTGGQEHYVTSCFIETFDQGEADNATTFSGNGKNFTLTGNWTVNTETPNTGLGGSAFNLKRTSGTGPFTIAPDDGEITVNGLYLYLSSIADGADPTADGAVTIRGLRSGSQEYTFTKTSGFATDFSANSGYTYIDFSAENGDPSIKVIDQLEISIGGAFTYLNLDNFSWCADEFPPAGYTVNIDQNPITQDNQTAVSFTFADAEVGTTYNYTFTGTGGTPVTGTGTVTAATQQVTGINLTDLDPGTVTLSVTLTDASSNVGLPVTSTSTKIINNDPTDIILDPASINQSAGANAEVGTLSSTDPDVGDTYTYTLVDGSGGDNNDAFNISGNSLWATDPSILSTGSNNVRIRTTDNKGGFYEKAFTITVVDDVAPTISSVSVPADAIYITGQNLDFTVNVSENVTVIDTPQLPLTIGTTSVNAAYMSGSATSALLFRYTVQTGDIDTDGIEVGAAIVLNGGTINDGASHPLALTLNSVGGTTGVLVDGVNDAPTVSGLPAGITIIEDTRGELNIASSSFADEDSDDITVRLSVSDGRIALAATGIPVTLNGNATSAVTIAGAASAINSYIAIPSNIIYIPSANHSGTAAATLTVSADDGDGSGDVELGTEPINITAVNDAPVTVISPIPEVTEDTPAALTGMGVTDVDGDDQTLTFTVTGGTVTLGTAGISFGGSGNGTAAFTASGTLANINAALAAATFTPTPNLSGTDAGSISFVSNDGTAGSNQATVTFNIIAANGGPVFDGNKVIFYTENGTPARFNSGGSIELTESEGEAIIEAVITFNDQRDGDILSVEAPSPYAVSQAGNVITLTGTGTAAQMTSVLESIEYSNSGNDPTIGGTDNTRNITSIVKDASGISSNILTVQIGLTAVNDDLTMVSLPSDVIAFKNTASDLDLSPVTFSDVDAGSNSVTLTLEVSDGILAATTGSGVTVGGSGTGILTLSGTPSAIDGYLNSPSNIQYTGAVLGDNAAVLTLSANDGGNTGTGGGATVELGQIQIDITPVNDAPTVANPIPDQNATQGVAFSFQFAANTFADVDAGDVLTYAAQLNGGGNLPAWLSFDGDTRTFSGTPANSDVGSLEIDVIADDGNGGTVTDTFTLTVNAPPTVSGLPAGITIIEDTPGQLNIASSTFADSDSDEITVTLSVSDGRIALAATGIPVTLNGNGTSAVTLGGAAGAINSYIDIPSNIIYIPSANHSGTAAATLTVSADDGDGSGDVELGTVPINITAVNDAPVVTTSGGTTPFIERVIGGPVPIAIDDALTISDPDNTSLASANVAVTGNFQADEDLLAFVNDGSTMGNIDGSYDETTGTLMLTSVGATATLAEWQAALRAVTYSNNSQHPNTTTRTVSFEVNDGTADSAPATKDVNVVAVNTAPVAVDDPVTVNEDIPATGNALTNDSDVEGNALTASLVTAPVNGTVVLNADGSFTYTPNSNYNGLDSLEYQVCDNGTPSLCDTAWVRFTISAVNDAPIITGTPATTVNQDAAYSFTPIANDIDAGDVLTFSIANKPDWATFNANTGELSGTPGNSDVGTTTDIIITVSDGVLDASLAAFDLEVASAIISGLTLPNSNFVYDGTAKSLEIDGTLPQGTSVSYADNSRTDVGTQKVTATVEGAGYTPLVLTADLTVTRATITGITLDDGSFTYDGTAKSLTIAGTLPEGTSVSYADNSRTDVGAQEVTATITGSNYEDLVLMADLTVTPAIITGITLADASFVYDGTAQSLEITGTLPDGTTVAYTGNSLTDVGTQQVTATITGSNYDDLVLTADLTVTPATITGITLTDASFVYDGTAQSLEITGALPDGTSVSYADNSRTDIGTQEVTATVSGGNYDDLVLTADLTVAPATITGITLTDASFV